MDKTEAKQSKSISKAQAIDIDQQAQPKDDTSKSNMTGSFGSPNHSLFLYSLLTLTIHGPTHGLCWRFSIYESLLLRMNLIAETAGKHPSNRAAEMRDGQQNDDKMNFQSFQV